MKIIPAIAAILAFIISGNAALAGSDRYIGHWPVTVTRSKDVNGSYCLELGDFGEASLTGGWGNPTDGVYQIIAQTFVATIPVSVGTGGFDYLVFVAPAGRGNLAKGTFVYAGDPFGDGNGYGVGKAAFGAKGGC